jgi:quercetin dioxygenase-like cupin family protein
MAIPHLQSGQACSVLPADVATDTLQSLALFKDPHLEVIRMVLPAGKSIPPHHVNGPITIHCLAGEVVVKSEQQTYSLGAGDLQYFAGGVEHQLEAIQASVLLVSIVLIPSSAS